LTEFLPISSSGHLALAQKLMHLNPGDREMLVFDLAVHLGTLLAVLAVFRREMKQFMVGLGRQGGQWRNLASPRTRPVCLWVALMALVALVPTGIVALSFEEKLKSTFDNQLVIGGALLITGGLLLTTRFVRRPRKGWRRLGPISAILIGLAQGVAITPGISRSGATICMGLFCGLRRRWSAQFSFLLVVPTIFGAVLIQGTELAREGVLLEMLSWPMLIGAFVAFISGYAALVWLLHIIRRAHLYYFAWYVIPLGLLVILARLWW